MRHWTIAFEPPTDPCDGLGKEIDHLVNARRTNDPNAYKGLAQRIIQMTRMTRIDPEWEGHEEQIRSRRVELRKKLNDWNNNGCGDPPSGVIDALDRQVLSYDDLREIERQRQMINVFLGYLFYRGVRLLPSILFPPSIVPNVIFP